MRAQMQRRLATFAAGMHVAAGLLALLSATGRLAQTGAGPASDALHAVLGPTREHQRFLKALLGPLDGAQPGEPGFLRRFAWPRVIAMRTLRHGADLSLDGVADRAND